MPEAPSLYKHPMPPRMTEESYRPRVSDRTMVGNSATVTLASFANRRATVSTEKMEPQGEENFAASCDEAKDDRKSERVRVQLGGWMPRPKNFRHRAKGKLLLLTSPFIGLRRRLLVRTHRQMRNWQSPRGSQLPVCPSTAHNRNLGRRALPRLALNPSKWYQYGVTQDRFCAGGDEIDRSALRGKMREPVPRDGALTKILRPRSRTHEKTLLKTV